MFFWFDNWNYDFQFVRVFSTLASSTVNLWRATSERSLVKIRNKIEIEADATPASCSETMLRNEKGPIKKQSDAAEKFENTLREKEHQPSVFHNNEWYHLGNQMLDHTPSLEWENLENELTESEIVSALNKLYISLTVSEFVQGWFPQHCFAISARQKMWILEQGWHQQSEVQFFDVFDNWEKTKQKMETAQFVQHSKFHCQLRLVKFDTFLKIKTQHLFISRFTSCNLNFFVGALIAILQQ